MPVLPRWLVVAFLTFFLLRICLAWARSWRRGTINVWGHRLGARLGIRGCFFSARWRRQRHLLELRFGVRRRQRSVIFVFFLRCVLTKLRALSLQFALALTEKFLHVFRHARRFREIFLGLVLQKILHEIDKKRKRADAAGHLVPQRFLLAGVTHPHAGHVGRRVTDEPNIGVIVNGARLARERHA